MFISIMSIFSLHRARGAQQARGLLGDHDGGRVCVPGDDRGHDGAVSDPQAAQPVHL